MKTALIDADSLIYILAWQFREYSEMPEEEMQGAIDEFIDGIFLSTGASDYIGAFGHTEKCFRYRMAKHQPYKAGRKELDPNVDRWRNVARSHFQRKWAFASHPELEADDIISLAAEHCIKEGLDYVVCSPDKDLNQIPGEHFDYKKQDFSDISTEEAQFYFWMQMLTGDSTDNVAGIRGLGPKKATEKLGPLRDRVDQLEARVRGEYLEYYADYYGMRIFGETKAILSLVDSTHPYFQDEFWTLVNSRPVPVRGS